VFWNTGGCVCRYLQQFRGTQYCKRDVTNIAFLCQLVPLYLRHSGRLPTSSCWTQTTEAKDFRQGGTDPRQGARALRHVSGTSARATAPTTQPCGVWTVFRNQPPCICVSIRILLLQCNASFTFTSDTVAAPPRILLSQVET
jgi:hypothetical protein